MSTDVTKLSALARTLTRGAAPALVVVLAMTAFALALSPSNSADPGVPAAMSDQRSDAGPATDPGGQTRDSGTPLQFSRQLKPSLPHGLEPRAAIGRVLRGLGPDSPVIDVETSIGPNGPNLRIHLAHSADQVPDVWAAGLTTGAIGELIRTGQTALSQVIATASAYGPGPDGLETWTGVGLGAARLGQRFESPADAVLEDRVRQVADTFRLAVDAVEVLHPLEGALSVTFTLTDDVPIDWNIGELREALVGDAPVVEGILIRVRSASGRPVATAGVAYRTGEGGAWCDPAMTELCGAQPRMDPEGTAR